MSELKPGWIARQFHRVNVDVATWPKYMREQFRDDALTPSERKEAATILRARADELDPSR